MKKVLLVAFHFPPAAMGSGHLRTLGFARHLPGFGWEPVVLSTNAAAFPQADSANNGLIPEGCHVHRAPSLDLRRQLGVRGKYPAFMAQPDRWASWWPLGVMSGLQLIRRYRIDAVWSTYPIMTAHCIAHTLSHLARLPWIADFRDPVTSSVEAGNPYSVAAQKRWEQRVLARANRIVLTTPGAMKAYAARFPAAAREQRLAVIPNGYDEAAFVDLPAATQPRSDERRALTLIHSGMLYPEGRNPLPFFTALARLKASGALRADDLRIVLRASGAGQQYETQAQHLGLGDIVKFAPPIPNRDALIEQGAADALLLFQGSKFDHQIPAKLYEYLRIGHPIFALVGEHGDTAALLRETGGAILAPMDDVSAIAEALAAFLRAIRSGHAPVVAQATAARYSRAFGAATLANLLDQVTAGPGADGVEDSR
ncbi:MAG TPA: glycosyltransferase [Rhodanobacteraceae bacterium]|nr:glycosyltransferase [Rhodanobacteraceae bacterium]